MKTCWTCHMDALMALRVALQCPAVNLMITIVCRDIHKRPGDTHIQILLQNRMASATRHSDVIQNIANIWACWQ